MTNLDTFAPVRKVDAMRIETRLMLLSGFCLVLMLVGWLVGHDLRGVALNLCDAGCWVTFCRVKGLRPLKEI